MKKQIFLLMLVALFAVNSDVAAQVALAKTTQMVSLIESVLAGKVDESVAEESTQP